MFVFEFQYNAALLTGYTALLGQWYNVVHVEQTHDGYYQNHGILHVQNHGILHVQTHGILHIQIHDTLHGGLYHGSLLG